MTHTQSEFSLKYTGNRPRQPAYKIKHAVARLMSIIKSLCHATISAAHMAVGRFLLLAQCWPDCLEITAWRPSESGLFCWHLQTVAEDVLILAVLVWPEHSKFFFTRMHYMNSRLKFGILLG